MDVLTIFRMALLGISFSGLCGYIRSKFDIHAYATPFASACVIVGALMAGGMLGILEPVWYLLYIGGFALFGYTYIFKRNKVTWSLAAFLLCAVVYGIWRFRGLYANGNDTVSHWALVVKCMMKYDSFPDASAGVVVFQSYPLGIASFIYYLCKGSGLNTEGAYACGQYLLTFVSFLPVFCFVRKNKPAQFILALSVFVYLWVYNINVTVMQVDSTQPIIALGATAAVLWHRNNPGKSMAFAILSIILLVYTKSSGMFFALLVGVAAALTAQTERSKWKTILKRLVVYIVVMVVAFAAWNLHVKLAYGAETVTKHAVSVSAYAKTFSEKTGAIALQIAVMMVKHILKPTWRYLIFIGMVGLMLFISGALAVRYSDEVKRDLVFLVKCGAGMVGLLLIWYVMLYFMYLFSMPLSEAIRLASLPRYEMSMRIYLMGTALMVLLTFMNRYTFRVKADWFFASCGLIVALFVMVICVKNTYYLKRVINRQAYSEAFRCMKSLRENYEYEDGKKVLTLSLDRSGRTIGELYYLVKYEFMTPDIEEIIGVKSGETAENHTYLYYDPIPHVTRPEDGIPVEDIAQTLLDRADGFDYILVLDENEAFEEALERFEAEYQGNAVVMYAY